MARSLRKPPRRGAFPHHRPSRSASTPRSSSPDCPASSSPAMFQQDESHPRVRGAVGRPLPLRPHPRRHPHLSGPGGGRRRSGLVPAARRLHHLHPSRPRPRPGQGRRREAVHGRTHGQGHRLLQGPGRLHAHRRHEPGHPRRQRHRGRGHRAWPRDRRWPRRCWATAGSPSASSATAPSTRASSTRCPTWPPSGSCPACSSARTTCTA